MSAASPESVAEYVIGNSESEVVIAFVTFPTTQQMDAGAFWETTAVTVKTPPASRATTGVATTGAVASAVTSLIYKFMLVPLNITYLQTIVFILVIAALVQFVEMFLKKKVKSLYNALGVYLPLITTNCAVLGVALKNVQNSYNFIESVVNGLAVSVGFLVAIVIMAGLREKIEYNNVPKAFRGTPIVLVTAGLMAIAFFGFSGLK